MNFKRPESVLVVVLDEHNQVLGLQRKDDANFWQSVTGSMEGDEVPIQTAAREVEEELGVDVDHLGYQLVDMRMISQYSIRPQWRHRYAAHDRVNTEYSFQLRIRNSQEIKLTEHLQFQWLSPKQALQRFWSASNRAAIQKCLPQMCSS